MASDLFGTIFIETQLEVAVMEQFREWMPTYIQEIELQLGRTRGEIPPPRSYYIRNDFQSFPPDHMPMCIVVSPGLTKEPVADGEGVYTTHWALGVGFAAAAKDDQTSAFLAKVYGAAGRKILLDRQSIGGIASGLEWIDHTNTDLVTEEERTIRASYDVFNVTVYDAVTRWSGPPAPADPVTQPGSNWPEADIVEIDAINVLPLP